MNKITMNFAALFLTLLSVAEANTDARQPPILIQSAPQKLNPYSPTPGLSIPLTCVAHGTPEPEYRWYKDGVEFDINGTTVAERGEGGTIVLDGNKDIGGYYQCVASNQWGKALSNNTYLPRAQLEITSQVTNDVTKKIGEGVRLACNHVTFSVPQPKYSWFIINDEDPNDETRVTENARVLVGVTGELYITSLQPDDQQDGFTYKCQARNAHAGTSKEGSPAKITVNTQTMARHVPCMLSTKRVYTALVGEDVSMECVFESFPAEHQILWNQLNVPSNRAVISKYETRFTIKAVEAGDAGTYQCWASNTQGTSYPTDIVLNVESKPTFLPGGELQNLEVVQGQDAKFTCLSTGIPAPNVTWSINGVDLDSQEPGPRKRYEDNGQSLVITNACKGTSDNNCTSDLYTVQCNVTNEHSYLYRGAALNVLLPTLVTVQPTNTLVNSTTTTLVATCTAVTDPLLELSYKWIHKAEQLHNDTDHNGKQVYNDTYPVVSIWGDNSLHLDFTLADDEFKEWLLGNYTCVAESGRYSGNDSVLIEAEKVEIPRVPGFLELYWWVFVIIAAVLLLIVIICRWCLWCHNNKKYSYHVDANERKSGKDPEKELKIECFQDYDIQDNDSAYNSKERFSEWEEMEYIDQ